MAGRKKAVAPEVREPAKVVEKKEEKKPEVKKEEVKKDAGTLPIPVLDERGHWVIKQ